MSEKQFDQFDEPFRKAAGQFEPEFSEDAWKKMEAKLEGEPKRRKPFGLWWFSDLVMITLVVTLLFEFNSGKSSISPSPDFTSNSQPVQEVKKVGAGENTNSRELPGNQAETTSDDGNETNPVDNDLTETIITNDAVTGVESKSYEKSSPNKTIAGYLKSSSAGNIKLNTTAASTPGIVALKEKKESFSGDKEVLASATGIEPVVPVPAQSNETSFNNQGQVSAQASEAGSGKPVVATNADSANTPGPNPAATSLVKPGVKSLKGFYLQAGLAPEWSFIAGNKPGPVTAAYGGSLGYQFGNRWSVQAGIFSTLKDYVAGPGDYKAKPGSYYATVKIFHVDAECRITELPLLVNYQVQARKKHSFVATAGFASLIMKKEKYDYHYERWNGMPGYSEHSYQTGVFHAFASMYLGGAYGFHLNQNLSVAAAPYIKIPLYGVGEGNVKITSAGAMLGLKYALGSRKNGKTAIASPEQK